MLGFPWMLCSIYAVSNVFWVTIRILILYIFLNNWLQLHLLVTLYFKVSLLHMLHLLTILLHISSCSPHLSSCITVFRSRTHLIIHSLTAHVNESLCKFLGPIIPSSKTEFSFEQIVQLAALAGRKVLSQLYFITLWYNVIICEGLQPCRLSAKISFCTLHEFMWCECCDYELLNGQLNVNGISLGDLVKVKFYRALPLQKLGLWGC